MNYRKYFDLTGKIAVVTGGAGLLGKESVKALSENGATVLLADIDRNKGRAVASQFQKVGLDVVFHRMDISNADSIAELLSFINKKFKRLDIWVNNAYPRTKDWGRELEHIKASSFKENIDKHLLGYFTCSRAAARYMRKRKSGSIISFASIYGMLGPDFSIYKNTKMTMPATYSIIKGGIINFTKYLSSYYGKYNIRVNCISPGGVFDKQPPIFIKNYISKTPLGRMARKDDIAGAVVFLASEASSYITGQNLVVDGGWSII